MRERFGDLPVIVRAMIEERVFAKDGNPNKTDQKGLNVSFPPHSVEEVGARIGLLSCLIAGEQLSAPDQASASLLVVMLAIFRWFWAAAAR